jgi:hypothetical protein
MAKFQNRLLISVLVFSLASLAFSQTDQYIGIWRAHNSTNEKTNSFIAIENISEKKYLVLFVDYYNNHKLDYCEFASIDPEGYITVTTNDQTFFLRIEDDQRLYHYWNTKLDHNATYYSKVISEYHNTKKQDDTSMKLKQMYGFIESQNIP